MINEKKYNEELEALIEEYGLNADHYLEDEDCSNCPLSEINSLIVDYFMGEVVEDDYEISPIEAMPDDDYANAYEKVITDICEKIGHCNCFENEDDVWFYHN